jgi:hypothetical protein
MVSSSGVVRRLPFLVAGVILLVGFYFYSRLGPGCVAIVRRSLHEPALAMPAGCSLTRDVAPDDVTRELESDAQQRGVNFKEWIVCAPLAAGETRRFPIFEDPRWLPTYAPGAFEMRRMMIIFPRAAVAKAARNNQVVAEVATMPWREFLRLIGGQCETKFVIWQ